MALMGCGLNIEKFNSVALLLFFNFFQLLGGYAALLLNIEMYMDITGQVIGSLYLRRN